MPVPRRTAGQAWRASSRVGHSRLIFSIVYGRAAPRSRLEITSAMPKRPIATGTKPTPSASAEMPNVKRVWPEAMSVPMSPRKRPSTTMATERTTEPCAKTTAAIMPNTRRPK